MMITIPLWWYCLLLLIAAAGEWVAGVHFKEKAGRMVWQAVFCRVWAVLFLFMFFRHLFQLIWS